MSLSKRDLGLEGKDLSQILSFSLFRWGKIRSSVFSLCKGSCSHLLLWKTWTERRESDLVWRMTTTTNSLERTENDRSRGSMSVEKKGRDVSSICVTRLKWKGYQEGESARTGEGKRDVRVKRSFQRTDVTWERNQTHSEKTYKEGVLSLLTFDFTFCHTISLSIELSPTCAPSLHGSLLSWQGWAKQGNKGVPFFSLSRVVGERDPFHFSLSLSLIFLTVLPSLSLKSVMYVWNLWTSRKREIQREGHTFHSFALCSPQKLERE